MIDSYFFLGILGLLSGFFMLWRIRTCGESGDLPSEKSSAISIIVPARNEEENIKKLLSSLSIQASKPGETIVVDDQSTDRTTDKAAEFGAVVLRSKPLPPGWTGKNWACYQGANKATGKTLLFLDADTWFPRKDSLSRLIGAQLATGGVLSIAPYHHIETLYEHLSAYFNIITLASTNAFTPFGDSLQPKGLFGPCLAVNREDYRKVGGHDTVKGKVLENFFLAAYFRKKKIQLHCRGGMQVLSYRMYPNGLRELIQGWSKAFSQGAARTSFWIVLLVFSWICGQISTLVNLLSSLMTGEVSLHLAVAFYILYALQIGWMLRRLGNFGWPAWVLFPIPLVFFLALFCYSVFAGNRVSWKGRGLSQSKGI